MTCVSKTGEGAIKRTWTGILSLLTFCCPWWGNWRPFRIQRAHLNLFNVASHRRRFYLQRALADFQLRHVSASLPPWGVMNRCDCNVHRPWLQQRSQGKKVALEIKVKPSVEDPSVFVEPQPTRRAVVAIAGCCYGNRWCTYRILRPSCRVNLNQIRQVLKISECIGTLHNVWRGIRLFYGVLLMELHLHSISCSSYSLHSCTVACMNEPFWINQENKDFQVIVIIYIFVQGHRLIL